MFRILIRCSGTGILGYFTQNAPLCLKIKLRFENKVKLWDKISNIGRWFTFSGVSVCRLGGGGSVPLLTNYCNGIVVTYSFQ